MSKLAIIQVGPRVLTLHDPSWFGHPLRTFYSCQGCFFAEVSTSGDRYCTHADFLRRYGCKQYSGQNYPGMLDIGAWFCPALNGKSDPPQQPTTARYAVRVRDVRKYLDTHRPEFVALYGYRDEYAQSARGCHSADWLSRDPAKRAKHRERLARCSWDDPTPRVESEVETDA